MVTVSNLGKNGQLGNQLWQIAAMIGYARKHGEMPFLKEWNCSYSKQDMAQYFPAIELMLCPGEKMAVENTYKEPGFQYQEIPHLPNLDLSGYFQSPLYWKHCEKIIRMYFQPSSKLMENVRLRFTALTLLNPDSQICSIHVRRKDYLNIASHNVVGMPYYEMAMQYVKQSLPDKKVEFAIFSDDIEWCKSNFPAGCSFANTGNNVEDMFLMSLCHHNIIPNSTFSWWASWLNQNPDKIVVAPDRWFNNDYADFKDVYADYMVKLDADGKSSVPVNAKPVKCAVLVYHKNVLEVYPENWINEFQKSIMNQTYKEFDIFEIDYSGHGNRLFPDSHYYSAEKENFVHALITLIEMVKGEYNYIFNTNVDDYYSLDRIEKQIAKLKAGYDVVSSNFQLINDNGSAGTTTQFEGMNIPQELGKGHNVIAHPVVAFKASFFDDFHYNPNEIPAEDMKLWQRSVSKKKYIILPETLLFHRLHKSSLSRSKSHPEQIKKANIGLLLIATNKYKQFVQPLLDGIAKHFVKDSVINVHLFTDSPDTVYKTNDRVQLHIYKIPPYKFPQATLYRYKIFDFFAPYLKEDYLFYMDVDMRIERDILASDICAEGKLTAVRHPGFYYNNGWGSPNTNPKSTAALREVYQKTYYAGGFQGGYAKLYLAAVKLLKSNIEVDENAGVMAEWHDETHWNWLHNYPSNSPTLLHVLTPAFCHLDGVDMQTIDGKGKLDRKIVAINKKHEEVREVV